jgi:predicted transposase YdaD
MLGMNLEEPRVIREAREEGREEGERSLILRQLTRRLGDVPDRLAGPIQTLTIQQLESLGEALLDFGALSDLEAWLEAIP